MTQPKFLAIETTQAGCSVALSVQDDFISSYEEHPQKHTQRLVPMIQSVLEEGQCALSDIHGLALTVGPGSFTGVRVGISMVQALSYGLNVPIFGYSTLKAIAAEAFTQFPELQTAIVAIDARMGQCFCNVFMQREGKIVAIGADQLIDQTDLSQLFEQYPDALGVGALFENLPFQGQLVVPSAKAVLQIALSHQAAGEKGVRSQDLKPQYIRQEVAQKSAPKTATVSTS